jgi:hypothetical protein
VDIQAITYRGRTVAACTRRRFFLSDDIADRDPNDPLVSFVIGMCLYATWSPPATCPARTPTMMRARTRGTA